MISTIFFKGSRLALRWLRPVGVAVGPKRPHADAPNQAAAVSGANRP